MFYKQQIAEAAEEIKRGSPVIIRNGKAYNANVVEYVSDILEQARDFLRNDLEFPDYSKERKEQIAHSLYCARERMKELVGEEKEA